MKPGRNVTKSLRVEEYLQSHEFSRRADIASALKLRVDQVAVALNHLRNHGAVDVVVEHNGVGWWFVTPEHDQRTRRVQEIVEERKVQKGHKHKRHVHTRKAVKS